MTRKEVQPAWEKIVDIAIADYQSLTPEQRIWFNVELLSAGGIVDHYVNSLAEHNQETIADLKTLGFPDVAEMLIKVNSFFKNGVPPLDIDERNDELASFNDEDNALLEALEKQFWARSKELDQTLLEFINKTGIGNIS
jgi:hypothetical protein